jgi:hypothetical protein
LILLVFRGMAQGGSKLNHWRIKKPYKSLT